MSKKIIQDIYTTNKKSIRMITKSDVRPEVETKIKDDKKDVLFKTIPKRGYSSGVSENEKVNIFSQFSLWVISIGSVVTVIFLITSTFSTASVRITPKVEEIVLDNTYDISKNNDKELTYEIMTIKRELSKGLKTDGEEDVERKALGKAIIYNIDSTSKQRLINNTRLETSEGLIYKIRESVDVPGYKVVGGVKTPGSVEVEIIADMPGEKYNMKLSDFKGDFTIPGFKNSTKFDTFYARLSADVSGGLVGKVKKVSEDKLISAREELKNNLKTELIKDIYSQKPDYLFFFKDNYYIQYSDLPDSSIGDDYNISMEATINVVVFNKDVISNFIAQKNIEDFDDSKVDIIWDENISSKIFGSTEKPWGEDTLKIKLTGDAKIVWQYDIDKILNKIKGQNKKVLSNVIQENGNSITVIEATIRPQWRKTFPDNVKKIKVVDLVREASII